MLRSRRRRSSSANHLARSLSCDRRRSPGVTLVRPDGYIAYSAHSHDRVAALGAVRSLVERQTGRTLPIEYGCGEGGRSG